jgi:GST-like protein
MKVPVIVDREAAGGQPYTVFESGAILVYLADKTGQFLPKEGAARYDALQRPVTGVSGTRTGIL